MMSLKVTTKLFAMLKDLHEMGPLRKDGNNQEQHYKFLSERQIKEVIQPLMVKHGLMFLPLGQRITSTGTTPKGTQRLTDIAVRYAWVDIESGESIEGEFVGTGADSNDKGVYKALTGGGKQLMCNTFWIPSGDDPERDQDGGRQRVQSRGGAQRQAQNPEGPISEAQLNRLFALTNKVGMDKTQARQIIGNYGYESSKDIRVKDYEAICKEIDPSLT